MYSAIIAITEVTIVMSNIGGGGEEATSVSVFRHEWINVVSLRSRGKGLALELMVMDRVLRFSE